jgi:hypothetical protein
MLIESVSPGQISNDSLPLNPSQTANPFIIMSLELQTVNSGSDPSPLPEQCNKTSQSTQTPSLSEEATRINHISLEKSKRIDNQGLPFHHSSDTSEPNIDESAGDGWSWSRT